MRQASLKLKMSIQNINIMNNNIDIQKTILNSMLSTLALLAFLYILILGNMVFNIVQRRTLEKEALTLSSEVGNLELSYLSLLSNTDFTLSSSMGFKETKATFATRKSLGYILLNLNLDKNEI